MDGGEEPSHFGLGSVPSHHYRQQDGIEQDGLHSQYYTPFYPPGDGGTAATGQQQQHPLWNTYDRSPERTRAEQPSAYASWSLFGNNSDFAFPSTAFPTADPAPATIPHFGHYEDYIHSLSQPESNSGSESGHLNLSYSSLDGLAPNMDLNRAAEMGREMYADAANSLHSQPHSQGYAAPSYDLFGARDLYHDEEVASVSAQQAQQEQFSSPQQQNAKPVDQPRYSPNLCAEAKLSYSEVARNKLPPQHPKKSSKTKRDDAKQDKSSTRAGFGESLPPPQKREHRKTRPAKSQPVRTKHAILEEPRPIRPDSRYGLDTFDDLPGPSKDEGLTSKSSVSSGSLPQSRKGSTSSVGSGSMSGIDDIPLPSSSGFDKDDTGLPDDAYETAELGPGAGSGFDVHKAETLRKESSKTAGNQHGQNPAEANSKKTQAEKPFFDPKRIFKNNIPNNQQKKGDRGGSKPSGLNRPGSSCYINNDLRDSNSKDTNRDANHGSSFPEEPPRTANPNTRRRAERPGRAPSAASSAGFSSQGMYGRGQTREGVPRPTFTNMREPDVTERSKLDGATAKLVGRMSSLIDADNKHILGEWMLVAWSWFLWGGQEFFVLLWDLAKLLLKLALLVIVVGGHYVVYMVCKGWYMIQSKPWTENTNDQQDGSQNASYQNRSTTRSYGLKENITLPVTGDDAMKRLLSCKGKDPYSILGLRADASSDDIKKYYRRQAVLVHPDKNQQPGAEEAFKILGHAFDLIGDPVKRSSYDAQRFEADEAQTAMHEFADLLTKLHEKMQEAANMMMCDHCGGKHKRVPVDVPAYSARFCDRCNIKHPAKEGDVWAESSFMGFRWHFFACMEGKVYNITEWASCKSSYFKQMQANSHHVMYRIHTGAGRQRQGPRTEDADLKDFFNNLFKQGGGGGAGGGGGGAGSSGGSADGANSYQHFNGTKPQSGWAGSTGQTAQGNTKKSRRRRKRH